MGRPKINPGEKRDRRFTVYLTKAEEEILELIAKRTGMNKSAIMCKALDNYIDSIENPTPGLNKTTNREIMELEKEQVDCFVCIHNHPFWIEWAWPRPPRYCPICGVEDENIRSAWTGIVKQGLRF